MNALALLFPAVAVVAIVESVRTAPVARAAVRARRRLLPGDDSRQRRSPEHPLVLRVRSGVRRALDERRQRTVDRQVPERLDRIVRRLRSGSSLTAAIIGAGTGVGTRPSDDVLGGLVDELVVGRPLVPSVARWGAGARRQPNRRLAAVALELTAESGGASATVLDGVTETLRDRVALEREVVALSSQSRASAVLLVVAPVVFTMLVGAVEPRLWSTLWGSAVGRVCVVAGLGLDVLGAVWMARLIGRHR